MSALALGSAVTTAVPASADGHTYVVTQSAPYEGYEQVGTYCSPLHPDCTDKTVTSEGPQESYADVTSGEAQVVRRCTCDGSNSSLIQIDNAIGEHAGVQYRVTVDVHAASEGVNVLDGGFIGIGLDGKAKYLDWDLPLGDSTIVAEFTAPAGEVAPRVYVEVRASTDAPSADPAATVVTDELVHATIRQVEMTVTEVPPPPPPPPPTAEDIDLRVRARTMEQGTDVEFLWNGDGLGSHVEITYRNNNNGRLGPSFVTENDAWERISLSEKPRRVERREYRLCAAEDATFCSEWVQVPPADPYNPYG